MFDYEKCQYCGSEEVKYNPLTDEYVKCMKCGQTLRVASFEREHLRIGEQIKAKEKAEEDLRQAQQEKENAQKQLEDAVSALTGIQSAQESGIQALTELLKGQSDAKFGQQEIMGFMQVVRQEGRQGQDTLTCLMQAAIRNQSTNEEKLDTLQGLAQDILAAGDNLADLVQACVQHIHIGKEEQNALISQLISWSKETHKEDIQRLEKIQRVSHALQDSVGNIDRKVDDLGRKADETRQALDDLRDILEEDKRIKLVELYHQANNALFEQRFEDASRKYKDVLAGGGKDAEVYWRIVLCHYCVEYQWDDEARLIPTLINPDLTEPERITARLDLERCISGTPQAEYYLQRLKDIDWVLDRYRQVKDQMQYDVFISVKQSFENHDTMDSDIASDLYDHLKGLGLRVFNSRRCKKDFPLGKDAEPYIISALLSSRVLIVVGTNHDYMNAQWVRNEWSRFQWLIKKDEEKRGSSDRLLFCYLGRGMSPYDIPRALNTRNQVVIDGGDAYEIIDREMNRIFSQKQMGGIDPRDKYPPKEMGEFIKRQIDLTMTYIRQGKFQNAEAEIGNPDFLRADPNNPNLWLCKALIRAKARTIEDLYYMGPELKQNEEFKTAIEKATGNLKKQLQECLDWSDYTPAELSDGTVGIDKYLGEKESTAQIPTRMKNKTVTHIMNSCFENCQFLFHIAIPSSVTSLGRRAFAKCQSLKEITIPDSVNHIEDEVFVGCASLQAINVEAKNSTYASLEGVLLTKKQSDSTLICYPQGRSASAYTVPSGVSMIGHFAFYNCTSLHQITIHNKIIAIENNAIVDCPTLEIYGQAGSETEKYAKKLGIPFHDKDIEEEEFMHFQRAQNLLDEAEKHEDSSWSHDGDIRKEKNKAAVEELAQIDRTLKNEVCRDKYIQLVMKWKELSLAHGYKRISRILTLFTAILVALFLGILLYFANKQGFINHVDCPVNETVNAEAFPNNFLIPVGKWFCTLLKPFGIDDFIALHSEDCPLILSIYLGSGFFVTVFGPMLLLAFVAVVIERKSRDDKRKERRENKKKRDTFRNLLLNESTVQQAKRIVRIDELNQLWDGIGDRLAVALGIATGFLSLYFQRDYFSDNTFIALLRLAFLVALPGFLVWIGISLLFDHLLFSKSIIGKRIMTSYNENIKKWDESNKIQDTQQSGE